jgi:hypothetical protein
LYEAPATAILEEYTTPPPPPPPPMSIPPPPPPATTNALTVKFEGATNTPELVNVCIRYPLEYVTTPPVGGLIFNPLPVQLYV